MEVKALEFMMFLTSHHSADRHEGVNSCHDTRFMLHNVLDIVHSWRRTSVYLKPFAE